MDFSGPYKPGGVKFTPPHPMNSYTTVVRGLVFGPKLVHIKFRKNPYFGLSPIFGSGAKGGQYFKKNVKKFVLQIFEKIAYFGKYFFKLHSQVHFSAKFAEILICCREHSNQTFQKCSNLFFDIGPKVKVFRIGSQNFDISNKGQEFFLI